MTSTEDTDALLDRVAAGDPCATNRLLDRHRAKLRRMVEMRMDKRLLSRLDPSDVVQEGLADASRALPEFVAQRSTPFYAWLREITRNKLIDLHRRHILTQKRSVNQETPIAGDLSEHGNQQLIAKLVSSQVTASQQFAARERNRRVRELLDEMPSTDREVLVLRYLEHVQTKEAAAILQISENSYAQRHLRAVRRLRELLVQDGDA